jgi:hypothetical protein
MQRAGGFLQSMAVLKAKGEDQARNHQATPLASSKWRPKMTNLMGQSPVSSTRHLSQNHRRRTGSIINQFRNGKTPLPGHGIDHEQAPIFAEQARIAQLVDRLVHRSNG